MRLRKPPYPDCVGTAVHFLIQSSHREAAFLTQTGVIRDAYGREEQKEDDCVFSAASVRDWLTESIAQGVWLCEYHYWEAATKYYFDSQHLRNGSVKVNWKKPPQGSAANSHLSKVLEQLATFGANVPADILDALEGVRRRVNEAKHEGTCFATEPEACDLFAIIAAFWDALDPQEEFTPATVKSHTVASPLYRFDQRPSG